MSYPTPPPTNSPKGSSFPQYHEPNPLAQPYEHPAPSYGPPPTQIPAQDSYFHPSDPQFAPPQQQQQQQQPPRRSSSYSPKPSPSPFTRPFSPLTRASPPPRRRSPGNPNYYSTSPLPVPLTPYNLNRPQPRPGFLKRILNKIESWIRAFMRWSKRNPLTAGILTFLPVMTIAGIAKIGRVIGKGLGVVDSGRWNEGERKKGVDAGERGIMDAFDKLGGRRRGPLEGFLKILHMLV